MASMCEYIHDIICPIVLHLFNDEIFKGNSHLMVLSKSFDSVQPMLKLFTLVNNTHTYFPVHHHLHEHGHNVGE